MVKLELIDQVAQWSSEMIQDNNLIYTFFAIPEYLRDSFATGDSCIYIIFMSEPWRQAALVPYLQSNITPHHNVFS